MLTLGFIATIQLAAVYTRVSALKQAAMVAPGFTTTLALDMLAFLPSLASQYKHLGVSYPILCCIWTPDELTTPWADNDRVCNLNCNSSSATQREFTTCDHMEPCYLGIIPLGLNPITTQAVALCVTYEDGSG